MIWLFIFVPVGAYLLGSVSFAWIAGALKGVNLREHGSGNLGATNAGRVLGGRWFAAVFLADVAKGVIPAVVASHLPSWLGMAPTPLQAQLLVIAAVAGAILGHVFTLFHGFRGGKAVATSLGVLIGMLPLVAAATFGVWVVVWSLGALIFKRGKAASVGPASVVAALLAPVWHILFDATALSPAGAPFTIFVFLLAALVVIRHRSNIAALFKSRSPATTAEA